MKRGWFGIALVVMAGAAVFYLWDADRQRTVAPAAAPLAAPVPSTTPADTPPAIRYPVQTPTGETAVALPALDQSDAAAGDALAQLLGLPALPAFVYPDGMIRRFVATVDNLPRRKLPPRLMPVRPVAGRFAVSGTQEPLSIAPHNSARYRLYVEALEAVAVPDLMDAYARFYPLLQQAYVELGYPRGYFNDRLVEVIDHLLAVTAVDPPVALVRPSVMYRFSDARLESLSAGEKILIRMGDENARRVKQVLRAVRAELVRRTPAT